MGTILKKAEINEGMKKMIEENALALATINEKGEPHNIAIGFVKVISKNQLLISNNWFVETANNIKKNPNVSLAVWARNWEENCIGYEFKGRAEEFTSGKWLEEIKKIPINEGLFKAAIGNIVISAVVSDVVGIKFVIRKISKEF